MVRVKLSDFKKINGKIKIRFSYSSFFHSVFHNIGCSYFFPIEIINSNTFQYFNTDESNFIKAARCYNEVINCRNKPYKKKISQIFTGEKFHVRIESMDNKDVSIIEFDERKFTELAKRYSSMAEIRKSIRELFTYDTKY